MILLVDDDRSVRQLTRRLLSELGHEVLVAEAAEDALVLFARHLRAIELLVTDLVLPSMSGRELADRIRQLEPGIPVLYISGDPAAIVDPEDLPPGTYFLAKPFEPQELSAAVEQALRRRGS